MVFGVRGGGRTDPDYFDKLCKPIYTSVTDMAGHSQSSLKEQRSPGRILLAEEKRRKKGKVREKRRVRGKKEEFANLFFLLPLICFPNMELLPQEQMKEI